MVEGGARVIRSFLHAARGAGGDTGEGGEDVRNGGGGGAVDALVVTVAPVLVGDAGVGYGAGLCADEVRPPPFLTFFSLLHYISWVKLTPSCVFLILMAAPHSGLLRVVLFSVDFLPFPAP